MTDDRKWQAVATNDPAADGSFVYAVRTTGVYCRPSCTARPALRKNVLFFATPEEAERFGFRPCKRCRPRGPRLAEEHAAAVAKACAAIEAAEEPPGLEALAKTAGMSPFHFHRVFKAATGVTPKAYAAAQRARRVREELRKRSTVTEAIYGAGFNSNGRFYARAAETLGMMPKTYQTGGASVTIRFAIGECTLGAILVAASAQGVCAIFLGDDPETLARDLQDRFPRAHLIGGDTDFEKTVAAVVGFVAAPQTSLDLPLEIRGTAFQQRVWQALREIPPGSTASYAEIARRVGASKAVRAVARACAANALAVAIPCHRVVRTDGGISGYRWGVAKKQALLALEQRQPSQSPPSKLPPTRRSPAPPTASP